MPTGKVHPFEPADLFVTERLYERPHRPPDLHAEAEAFHELSAGLLSDPDASVHRFLELALQLRHAGSAGLSLIEHDERDEEIFRWALIKGSYAHQTGGWAPRSFSPCSRSLQESRTVLTYRPARTFHYFQGIDPEIIEGLVVPLYGTGMTPLGALWILSHDEERQFDAEDARIMQQLAVQLVLALKLGQSTAAHQKVVRKLRRTVEAKEMVNREVNHRVKNTIQTAVSLLRLQSRLARGSEAKELLEQAEKRLGILGRVHELLYWQAQDVQAISMGVLLNATVEGLRDSFSGVCQNVAFEVDIEDLTLHPDQAIPLALIANEAITNACKHGFPDGRKGTIQVRLADKDHAYVLIIKDDGRGMAADPSPGSLGLRLITTLAAQIDAELAFEREPGTQVRVLVPH